MLFAAFINVEGVGYSLLYVVLNLCFSFIMKPALTLLLMQSAVIFAKGFPY